jgi:hypothetical protein
MSVVRWLSQQWHATTSRRGTASVGGRGTWSVVVPALVSRVGWPSPWYVCVPSSVFVLARSFRLVFRRSFVRSNEVRPVWLALSHQRTKTTRADRTPRQAPAGNKPGPPHTRASNSAARGDHAQPGRSAALWTSITTGGTAQTARSSIQHGSHPAGRCGVTTRHFCGWCASVLEGILEHH